MVTTATTVREVGEGEIDMGEEKRMREKRGKSDMGERREGSGSPARCTRRRGLLQLGLGREREKRKGKGEREARSQAVPSWSALVSHQLRKVTIDER